MWLPGAQLGALIGLRPRTCGRSSRVWYTPFDALTVEIGAMRMKILGLSHYEFSVCAAIVILVGWGGSQPLIGSPSATQPLAARRDHPGFRPYCSSRCRRCRGLAFSGRQDRAGVDVRSQTRRLSKRVSTVIMFSTPQSAPTLGCCLTRRFRRGDSAARTATHRSRQILAVAKEAVDRESRLRN
jgi:hypothetical protein